MLNEVSLTTEPIPLVTGLTGAPLGMVVIGPLVIGAILLGLVGLGAVYLSQGNRQQRRIGPPSGQYNNRRLGDGKDGTQEDPLRKLSLEELKRQAGSLLIAADNAIRSSEQEVLFAQASYGDEQVKPFENDITEAKQYLSESFRLQHKVDAAFEPEESSAIEAFITIIKNCEKINDTLESHREEFDAMRNLERDATPALAALETRVQQANSRHHELKTHFNQLTQAYTEEALGHLQENLTSSEGKIAEATEQVSTARSALSQSDTQQAVLAIHTGEEIISDVDSLLSSAEDIQLQIRSAHSNLESGIQQTEQDLAQARALRDAGRSRDLTGPIAAAESALQHSQSALKSGKKINPIDLLHQVEQAHRQLDAPLNSIRDLDEKNRRARESLDAELLAARHQVTSTQDYVRSKRRVVGSTTRTRLAEAERCLSEAHSYANSEPAKALELAQRATVLAVQAAQIAQRESGQDDAIDSSIGFGTGFGGWTSTGSGQPFGYPFPRRGPRLRRRRGMF